MEASFLKELLAQDANLYCRYQTFRIHYYLRKTHFKRVNPFELCWDKDECGRYWLVGGRIFACKDDEDEKEIAAKIQLRANNANEYIIPIRELLNEKLNKRLEHAAFEHFSKILDVAITLGMDPITTLQTLLPGAKINLRHIVDLTLAYLNHIEENGDSVPFEDSKMEFWLAEVYPRLYADALDGSMLNEMHGNQFDKHLPTLLGAYNKRICSRFPSLSYLLSSKSENAYRKAKLAQTEAVRPVFRIYKDGHTKSLASLSNSRIIGTSKSQPKEEKGVATPNPRRKFIQLGRSGHQYEVNSRYGTAK